jgi:hypothetical protein
MTVRIGNRPVKVARAPRELVARLGRAVLWLVLAVVLLRGLTATLATRQSAVAARAASTAPAWPDDAARAFAAEFATAYLDQPPADTAGLSASRLADFVVPELADQLTLRPDPKGRSLVVRSVVPQDTTRLDDRHALVTVAALVGGTPVRTLRLTVPVARDARGGLVVYDLPSLAAAPERAPDAPPAGDPLTDSGERSAITDVLTRFLRAYVAGDRAGLSYLVPAGTRVGAVAGGFELLDVRSLTAVAPETGAARRVLVTVDVRDGVSRAVMALRYRVRLVRRDRWYVAELNTAGSRTR